jgi:hypothetical protein
LVGSILFTKRHRPVLNGDGASASRLSTIFLGKPIMPAAAKPWTETVSAR